MNRILTAESGHSRVSESSMGFEPMPRSRTTERDSSFARSSTSPQDAWAGSPCYIARPSAVG